MQMLELLVSVLQFVVVMLVPVSFLKLVLSDTCVAPDGCDVGLCVIPEACVVGTCVAPDGCDVDTCVDADARVVGIWLQTRWL